MPVYRYRATGRDGKPRQGVVDARDDQDARQRLTGRGWTIQMCEVAKLNRSTPVEAPAVVKKRSAMVSLVVVLLIAGAALLYFDPYGWFANLPIPKFGQ